ncbi:MAG TPA: LytTR family DNA-binding domain-containing protein [Candidatus Binatia bacterium]|nr:LytTR family DNA-binding domain-containing protein [Candidatus Binatia bacterium]
MEFHLSCAGSADLACAKSTLDASIVAAVKIRVLVVDDEPLARERVRQLLQEEPDIELIGECPDGLSAVQAIRKHSPELVFLDVQMPELDGFGVLAQVSREKMPAVIFVTAHDQFALKAFEVHAVDYLLKPFDKERFKTALRRAVDQIGRQQTRELSQRLGALLADVRTQPRAKYPDRLAIRSSGRVVLVKVDDIDWVEAADNYVSLHVGREEHLHRETMSALEAQLPPEKFMRISRSTIVHLDRIKELQPLFHGEYAVILRNGTSLTLSRGYRDKLDQLLGRIS